MFVDGNGQRHAARRFEAVARDQIARVFERERIAGIEQNARA
jgi:hypothetical protein